MPTRRKAYRHLVLFPPEDKLVAWRKALPKYKPADFRALLKEAKDAGGDEGRAFLETYRRRNRGQLDNLLRRLGIDPTSRGAWERGFFILAMVHYDVGHLVYAPRRTNANSANWTPEADLALLTQVRALRATGLSEREAIKELVADSKKRKLFPYRPQTNRHGSTRSEALQRQNALRARLHHLRSNSSLERTIGAVLPRSAFESIFMDLDMAQWLADLAKIGRP